MNIESAMSAAQVYDTAQKYIRSSALEIKETSPNQKIVAGGERQYDTTILIILLLAVDGKPFSLTASSPSVDRSPPM